MTAMNRTQKRSRARVLSLDARIEREMRVRNVDRETATEHVTRELEHLRAKGVQPYLGEETHIDHLHQEPRALTTLTGVIAPSEEITLHEGGYIPIPAYQSFTREVDRLQRELSDTYRDEEYAHGRRRLKRVVVTAAILLVLVAGWIAVGIALGALQNPF